MPDLSSYLQLVPSWNSVRPRFMNTVAVLVRPMVDAQTMLAQLTADFDIDTAIGVQLDMVGQWVGRSRWVEMPIRGKYFSLDVPEQQVGFDQGYWARPYDPRSGLEPMDDDTYRTLLKFKAIANEWTGVLEDIAPALAELLPGIALMDLGDTKTGLMSFDVLIIDAIEPILLAALEQTFFIKPSGVRANFIASSVPGQPLFGFDIQTATVAGFDTGAWNKLLLSL